MAFISHLFQKMFAAPPPLDLISTIHSCLDADIYIVPSVTAELRGEKFWDNRFHNGCDCGCIKEILHNPAFDTIVIVVASMIEGDTHECRYWYSMLDIRAAEYPLERVGIVLDRGYGWGENRSKAPVGNYHRKVFGVDVLGFVKCHHYNDDTYDTPEVLIDESTITPGGTHNPKYKKTYANIAEKALIKFQRG